MSRAVTLAEEFEKNSELTFELIHAIKQWCGQQPHLPEISGEMLALFLHSCHFSMELAKTTIDNYFSMRTHAPEFFKNRDPYTTNVIDGKNVLRYCILPRATPEGCRVLYMVHANLDPAAFDFLEELRSFTIATDVLLRVNGTFPGFLIVFDTAGLTQTHFQKLSDAPTGRMLYYLQEAIPLRLKGIHYINVFPYMDQVLASMQPFLKKELASMIHIHDKNMDTLYPFVPLDILPSDLGGNEASTEEIHETSLQLIQDHKDWLAEQEKLLVDEAKRPGKPKTVEDLFGPESASQ